MSRADGDRGRVPFAVVGVVLLVGAAVYAGTLGTRGPTETDRATDEALDRAEAIARTTLRVAGRRAVQATARHPVVVPANTTAGDAIAGDDTLEATVALRTAAELRTTLEETRTGRVAVETRLAGVGERPTAATAVESVAVTPTDGGAGVAVAVEFDHTARRDGRVVAERTTRVRVDLRLPLWAVSRRVERYERRLNRGPTAGPGLGRQLGARLTALAEARGLAQYAGAGVQNVVATRHVAVTTNGAMLRLQRSAFGRADPAGRGAVARAVARTAVSDALAAAENSVPPYSRRRAILFGARKTHGSQPRLAERRRGPPVTVGSVADTAYLDTLAALDSLTRRAYRATATRRVTVTRRDGSPPPAPTAPGPNWTAVDTERTTETVVRDETRRTGDGPLLVARRTVVVRQTTAREFRRGNQTRERREQSSLRYRVRLRLTGSYDPDLPGPSGETEPVFTQGGTRGGQNLAPAAADARPSPATVDRLAREAVAGGDATERIRVAREPPPGLRAWLIRDLTALHDRVRDYAVRPSPGRVVAGEASPSARLRTGLRANRTRLRDATPPYGGVAARLRAAVRAHYLDRVDSRLAERSGADVTAEGVRRALLDRLPVNGSQVRAAAREATTRPPRRGVVSGPGGEFLLVPDAEPSYLTVGPVPGRVTPAVDNDTQVTPLATRNVVAVAVPYADAADVVTGWLAPETDTVSLGTAGRALAAANQTLSSRRVPSAVNESSLRHDRDRLLDSLQPAVRTVGRRLRRLLVDRLGVSRSTAAGVVDATTDGRALGDWARAAADGSLAPRVAGVAADRLGLAPGARAELTVRLRVRLREAAAGDVAVPADTVTTTVDARRRLRDRVVSYVGSRGTEAAADRLRRRLLPDAFDGVLAGLPVAPVPGSWYATINLWHVTVRGQHPRFSVAVRRPAAGGTRLRYVREDAPVRLDTDADGRGELLGDNRAIRFRTTTAAVAAVPAGKSGVGDVDGNVDERSSAWACPDGAACGADNRSRVVTPRRRAATNRSSPRVDRRRARRAASALRPVDSRPTARGVHRRRRRASERRTAPD